MGNWSTGTSTVGNRGQCRISWANYFSGFQCNTLKRSYPGTLKWDSYYHRAFSVPINLPPRKRCAWAQGHSGSPHIEAESFTATFRCIYKAEKRDKVGWPVTEEEVNSVPLEAPGYCPSSRTRNVAACDLANSKHQFAVATGQLWSQPREEPLWSPCPGLWTGTTAYKFSVWKSCDEETVALCLAFYLPCHWTSVTHGNQLASVSSSSAPLPQTQKQTNQSSELPKSFLRCEIYALYHFHEVQQVLWVWKQEVKLLVHKLKCLPSSSQLKG